MAHSRHLWLDCPSNIPSAETLLDFLARLLPAEQQRDFFRTTRQYLQEDSEQEAFKPGGRLVKYLMESILSREEVPLFFYFDDLDRYTEAFKDTTFALGSFLSTFLQEDTCLRVIATSRNKGLTGVIKKLVGSKRTDIASTGDSLPPFHGEISRIYLEQRGNLRKYLSAGDFETFLQLAEGDPLALDGVEDVFERGKDPGAEEEYRTALVTFKAELKLLLKNSRVKRIPAGKRFERGSQSGLQERFSAVGLLRRSMSWKRSRS